MTVIFALFFMLLGFIAGVWVAVSLSLDLLRDSAKSGKTFIDKYRITLINGENQQE